MKMHKSWALTCVLQLRLENLCAKSDSEKARKAMENVLTFFDTYMAGQPQVEFLLNGITNSDPCAMFIAEHGCEKYRAMAEKFFFGTEQPSARKLKKLLEGAA